MRVTYFVCKGYGFRGQKLLPKMHVLPWVYVGMYVEYVGITGLRYYESTNVTISCPSQNLLRLEEAGIATRSCKEVKKGKIQ